MSDIQAQVHQAIGQALEATLPEQAQMDRDAVLMTAGGLDSIQVMNLVMEIEDQLDVSVPVDVLAEAQTLNELANKLVDLVKQRQESMG